MLALKRPDLIGGLRRLPRLAADLVLPPTCPGCGGGRRRQPRALRALLVDGPLHRAAALPGLRHALRARSRRGHRLGRGARRSAALPPGALGGGLRRRRPPAGASAEIPRSPAHGRGDGDGHAPRGPSFCCPDNSLIVPVPLYRWRLWRRQFNQAALLAAGLAKLAGVPHDPLVLERIKPTRQPGRAQR